ncbi:Glycosyltransferase involved in cell wall bisynthesis [Planococcus glaciei]|uniref:glycosyltransferase family 2 protein n=1 Tax=Planococcus glaciei TaxID=459472 RepID=UPI0008856FA8|nr:glycosyltransferase family 2 protein [Planococcus glaciei]SDI33634.1 Glycosyltransferase involved in cell wall bisynthesis [Planococcus glaciei]
MDNNKGLSVIIPIYNVENYLEECLESVIQSMGDLPNIQIILVDDDSPDGSGRIARKYTKKHANFQYLFKENGGISEARNYGLQFVKYDYVTFIDSDDWIRQAYFERVIEAIQKKPDLIIFNWMDYLEGQAPQVVKGIEFAEFLWTAQPGAWNKVYNTVLFKNVSFPKGRVYEDVGTIYKLLYSTKDYIYINEALYNYRKNRKGSILSTVSSNINDLYEALESTYRFYLEHNALTNENRQGLCYQYVKLLGWSNMYRQLRFFKYNFWGFHRKMKATRCLIYTRFPEWKDNEFLQWNAPFFERRLGPDYIKRFDGIGKSFFWTFYTIAYLVVKNWKNYVQANKLHSGKNKVLKTEKEVFEWKKH